MAEVLVQGREGGKKGLLSPMSSGCRQRGDFRHNRFFLLVKHRFDAITSLPAPRKDVSGFLLWCRPLFKEHGKLHPEMQRNGLGGWFRSYRDTAMMSKPKERQRSEALTRTKYKQPGAGKQFSSRSLRGARRTTAQRIVCVHLGFAQVKW